jgi:hypothetical protein
VVRAFAKLFTWALAVGAIGCSPELPQWDGSGWRVASTPANGAEGVDRQGRITLALERLPFPNTVSNGTLSVKSGAVQARFELRFQPVSREVWLSLQRPLEPEITYQIDLAGVSDLDGDTLPEPYHARFKTGTQLGKPDPEPEVDVAQVLGLLRQRCAEAGCHSEADQASGLDLSKDTGIEATARNMASQAYNGGTSGGDIGRGTLFLASPLIIEATRGRGSPERSYLIYKVLGEEHILRDPMPPPGHEPLSRAEIQLLSDWIYAGAPTL